MGLQPKVKCIERYMGKMGHSHKLPEIERCCQILIPVFRRSMTDYRPYYDTCDMNQKYQNQKSDMLSMNEVYRLRTHYLGILCQSQNTKIYVNDTHTRYHDKLYSLTTLFIDFIDLSIFRIFLFDNFPFLPKYIFRNNLFCILPILPLIFIIVSVYRFFSLWICPIWTKSFYS